MSKSCLVLWLGAAAVTGSQLGACADAHESNVQAASAALADEHGYAAWASTELRSADGATIGYATFQTDDDTTLVTVSVQLAPEQAGIHGMHVHANDVADNGEGCLADPAAPASTHFVSVDGHWNPGAAGHGHHQGDLPALFADQMGHAWLQFLTDQFHPDELRGHALIVHASSDNYGNVPVGDGPDQYTPNSDAATTATANTGNAGARIACGVIE